MPKKDKDRDKQRKRTNFLYNYSKTTAGEADMASLRDDWVDLFKSAGRYAVRVRGLIPPDNRNSGHLISPVHVDEIGDVCVVMVMDDAGFAPDGIYEDGTFEIGMFIISAGLAKALGGTGSAAHTLGAMMMEAEEQNDAEK